MSNFYMSYYIVVMRILWDFTPCIFGFDPVKRGDTNVWANTSMALAATVGSAVAWMFVKFGKRKLLIIQCCITLIAIGIQMINNFNSFIIGRVMIGLSFGLSNTISPIFIRDINPEQNHGPMITLVQLVINVGFVFSSLIALFFPPFYRPNGKVADYCDPLYGRYVPWRELVGFPAIIALIQLVCLLFIFKREDPQYEEFHNPTTISIDSASSAATDTNQGMEMSFNVQSTHKRRLTRLERDTWKHMCKKGEIKKVFSGSIVRFLQQFSGINLILQFSFFIRLHSENIFFNLHLIVVIFSVTANFVAMYMLKYGKRKPILLTGALIACLTSCILFQTFQEVPFIYLSIQAVGGFANILLMITVILFAIGFYLTTASVIYVYAAEILTDKGMAISSVAHWGSHTIIGIIPNFGLTFVRDTKDTIKFHDTLTFYFFFFSGISIAGFFIITIFVKETKGKTRKEISQDFRENDFDLLTRSSYK
ncbi:unnamed protein product [Moneuplotes crassus]|uniref:Hexose transporter 1 n=2 Tax=Euplotes crassus TaxID=5936 RepID=A0AAD1UJN7_EUPCR|nr:unnamed protein product [Moneuplotes crassus]